MTLMTLMSLYEFFMTLHVQKKGFWHPIRIAPLSRAVEVCKRLETSKEKLLWARSLMKVLTFGAFALKKDEAQAVVTSNNAPNAV